MTDDVLAATCSESDQQGTECEAQYVRKNSGRTLLLSELTSAGLCTDSLQSEAGCVGSRRIVEDIVDGG
jgi:hypothetical protein